MSESKPNKVSLLAKTSLSALDAASPDRLSPAEVTTYQSLLGSVSYLSVMTRPDITQAVNYLSRFQAHPGAAHMAALKGVLYAHDEIYGQVTVTQRSPYIGNAGTHPRYMFRRANFSKVAQFSPKSGFSGDL
jgi:hypothetical protein